MRDINSACQKIKATGFKAVARSSEEILRSRMKAKMQAKIDLTPYQELIDLIRTEPLAV